MIYWNSQKKKPFIFMVVSFCLLTSCLKTKTRGRIIKTQTSGSWYPGDRKELQKTITQYLHNAESKPMNDALAIIVPHAGYQYSGPVAAESFKAIQNNSYERVVVLGPGHYYPYSNQMIIPNADFYETPLHKSPLDSEFIQALAKSTYFRIDMSPFAKEHSTDNQIPFIQHLFPDARIIPIIAGQFDIPSLEKAAAFFKSEMEKNPRKTLIVISSDFTHYGEYFGHVPFTENIKENLNKLDNEAASYILTKNASDFIEFKQKTKATICGYIPITFLLKLLPSETQAKLLKYQTSGEMTGDYKHTVSYLSFIFTGNWTKKMEKKIFSSDDKKFLLTLARKSLESFIGTGKKIFLKDIKETIPESVTKIQGGFVTLKTKKGQRLRGCIGEIMPTRSAIEVILDRTISAASQDPRFPPVKKEELSELYIEISLLTPPEKINSYKDIIIGQHGIIIEKNGQSAVFLPQVATEQNWDLETTLTQLSLKAGLGPSEWKKGTSFQVFEGIHFEEEI